MLELCSTQMRADGTEQPIDPEVVLPAGADTDGPCLIEPAVMCNHCGYCKSYGH